MNVRSGLVGLALVASAMLGACSNTPATEPSLPMRSVGPSASASAAPTGLSVQQDMQVSMNMLAKYWNERLALPPGVPTYTVGPEVGCKDSQSFGAGWSLCPSSGKFMYNKEAEAKLPSAGASLQRPNILFSILYGQKVAEFVGGSNLASLRANRPVKDESKYCFAGMGWRHLSTMVAITPEEFLSEKTINDFLRSHNPDWATNSDEIARGYQAANWRDCLGAAK